jgi:hypothetical protein
MAGGAAAVGAATVGQRAGGAATAVPRRLAAARWAGGGALDRDCGAAAAGAGDGGPCGA